MKLLAFDSLKYVKLWVFKLQQDILQIDYNNMSTFIESDLTPPFHFFFKIKFANSCSLHSPGETEAAVHENN